MLVECIVETIGQFHLVFILVDLYLLDCLFCVIILQVSVDSLRDQFFGHVILLAVNLRHISLFVELDFSALRS